MLFILVGVIGIVAGFLSGVVGTGASIILLPILTLMFSAKLAVPIMAISAVMVNGSKVYFGRQTTNWRAVWLSLILGVPGIVLGANTLWILPGKWADLVIGLFFLVLIPARYWSQRRKLYLNEWQFVVVGGILGYVTGVVFSSGPLTIPYFAAYGLAPAAIIASESASIGLIYLVKIATFAQLGALTVNVVIPGILIGATLSFGAYLGKVFVLKISESTFHHLISVMLLIAGLSLLWPVIF